MTADPHSDPYRSPVSTETDTGSSAGTPGVFAWLLMLTGATATGGAAFFATWIGSLVLVAAVLDFVAPRGAQAFGVLAGLVVFALSVAVSLFVAWLTGRTIRRLFHGGSEAPQ